MARLILPKILVLGLLMVGGAHVVAVDSLGFLPAPYNQLKAILPFNGHGWYLNAVWIEKLFANNNINTVVEVGSWLGASTRHMATLLPTGGKLYAVDTWLGSVEHVSGETGVNHLLPTLYEQFLSNVILTQLTNVIVPIRKDSLEAAKTLSDISDHFDLIYIDAAHDTESVYQDASAYFPYVKGGKGILCGDDWLAQSVRDGVIMFARENNLSVYGYYNFWFVAEEGAFKVESFINAPASVWVFPKQ